MQIDEWDQLQRSNKNVKGDDLDESRNDDGMAVESEGTQLNDVPARRPIVSRQGRTYGSFKDLFMGINGSTNDRMEEEDIYFGDFDSSDKENMCDDLSNPDPLSPNIPLQMRKEKISVNLGDVL